MTATDTAKASRATWYAAHVRCPKCGKGDVVQTCIGVGAVEGRAFQDDMNRAHCVCGWSGKVKDLTA